MECLQWLESIANAWTRWNPGNPGYDDLSLPGPSTLIPKTGHESMILILDLDCISYSVYFLLNTAGEIEP